MKSLNKILYLVMMVLVIEAFTIIFMFPICSLVAGNINISSWTLGVRQFYGISCFIMSITISAIAIAATTEIRSNKDEKKD